MGNADMRKLSVAFLLAVLGVPVAVGAQESLKQAETLRCFFETGHGFEWLDGSPITRSAEPVDGPIVVDRIDREAGRARLVVEVALTGEAHSEDVAVVVYDTGPLPRLEGRSTYGLTFLEISQAGAVSMITVWSPADAKSLPADAQSYPAAWSWHFALDVPTPEQNPGWCKVEG
ncbi:MAG: hypothetical protein WD960_15035 [Gemmatimonadota bacterium]